MYENEPVVFTDQRGQPAGIFVDVAEEIARRENWEIEWVPGSFAEGLERLETGAIDILVAVARTERREHHMDFSAQPVLVNWGWVYTRAEAGISAIVDLDGKTVAVLKEDVYFVSDHGLRHITEEFDIRCRFLELESYPAVMKALTAGRADAGLLNRLVARRLAPDPGIRKSAILLSPENIYFGFSEGVDPALVAAVNRQVSALQQDPDSILHRTMRRWLGRTTPAAPFPRWLRNALIGGAALLLLMATSATLSRVQVRRKTRELASRNEQLKHELAERRRAEEKLRESEERFQLAVEGSSDALWDWQAVNGDRAWWSPRYYELLGYEEGEIESDFHKLEKLLHPEDKDATMEAVRAHLEERAPYDVEYRLRTKSGEYRWFHARGQALWDDDGEPIRMSGSLCDITDRKRAEKELRFRAILLDNIWDCVTATDLDGRITYVNQAECESMGRSRAELIGQSVHVYGEDPAAGATQQEIIETTREKGEWRGEIVNCTAEGERIVFDCRTWLLRDDAGQPVGMCGTARDITERKRDEEERVRLATAIEQAAETVVITDAKGAIQYANPAFERITGYSRAEALGQNPRILKSGKHDDTFYRGIWDTLIRGEAWSGHFINKKKDGTLHEEEATISPVRDTTGKIVNYVAVKRDVTHEVELEAQLRQAQKMEAIGQLAGGVAHDFNNILTAILGNVELSIETLRGGLPAADTLLPGLEQVEQAAQRAVRLTRQLLVFSRRDITQPELLDLNQMLSEMKKMLRRLITDDIALEVVHDPDIRRVYVDAGQIEQVVMNLVVNARDAMPDGGRLVLETAHVLLDESYVAAHAEARTGPHVMLAVSDTGCGMSKETVERIFEPFFTSKPAGQGTGLGLALVYGIVKQAGGHVVVSSEPGEGTTFKIYLPVAKADIDQRRARPDDAPPPGGNETVLLCEDDEAVRVLAESLLREAGYTVIAADDGVQALERAAEHRGPIQLLITDVVMPNMNGRKLSDTLAATRPDLRTLFVSGYTSNIIAHHGVLDPGMEFLEKPYSRRGLLRRVREVLDKPRGVKA